MDTLNNLKTYIANYIKLEEDLNSKNKTIKEIRSKKNEAESHILKLLEEHNLKNTKINLNHCYIKYNVNETLCPLNMEFIGKCLEKYFNNTQKTNHILKFIESERNLNKKKIIGLKKLKYKSKKRKALKP
jgi:hypothetical protein